MRIRHGRLIVPVLSLSVLLGACAEAPTKQTIGTGVGAVGGALIGSLFGRGMGNVAATAVGGLLGAWAGSAAGKAWDEADKVKANDAFEAAHRAPVGERVSWDNPDSGHSGTVTTTAEHSNGDGAKCRDFQSTTVVDGKEEVVNGTACRQPDGSWAAQPPSS